MITSFHVAAHAAHAAAPVAANSTVGMLGAAGFIAFWVFVFRKPRGSRRGG